MADELQIKDYRHPQYIANMLNWRKWRLTYCGGDDFVDIYLKQYSNREDVLSFADRKCVTPAPCFAKAAVNDVKNSIFQRMSDIARRGGPQSYQAAIQGQENGVDLHGASMNHFIGSEVLPDLLTVAKVGIYVDMPELPGNNLLESAGKRPYLYRYRAEEIFSWTWRADKADEFGSVLLHDYVDECGCHGLPMGQWSRYRHLWIDEADGMVHVKYYNDNGDQIDKSGNQTVDEFILDIDFIPFVVGELSDSILSDVSNHQIALLNMESSDVMYSLKSNFPFYVEKRDHRFESPHMKPKKPDGTGEATVQAISGEQEIEVGTMQGRAYTGDQPPAFINPSSEPLIASMKKQQQLKDDIRQLINLSLSNIKPKMASAESKAIDERGLESGLSYIGLVLEHMERKIALYWSAYERSSEIATIKYPEKYSLMTDDEREKKIKQMSDIRDSVPSDTFRKTVNKEIVTLMIGHQVSIEQLDAIHKEIDLAKAYTALPQIINDAVMNGILDRGLAADLMGYPKGTADKANREAADRAAQIAKSQSAANDNAGARGVPDLSANPKGDVNKEKQQNQEAALAAGTGKPERGPAK